MEKKKLILHHMLGGLSGVPHVVHRRYGEQLFYFNKFYYEKCNWVISTGDFINCSVSGELQYAYLLVFMRPSHLTKRQEDISTIFALIFLVRLLEFCDVTFPLFVR